MKTTSIAKEIQASWCTSLALRRFVGIDSNNCHFSSLENDRPLLFLTSSWDRLFNGHGMVTHASHDDLVLIMGTAYRLSVALLGLKRALEVNFNIT